MSGETSLFHIIYDKLAQLFRKDWATREHVEIVVEIRVRRAVNGGNGHGDTIDDIDHLVSNNEVTFDDFDSFDEDIHPITFY